MRAPTAGFRGKRPGRKPPQPIRSRSECSQPSRLRAAVPHNSRMDNRKAVTLHRLREMHAAGEKIAMLTCYDASFARVLDAAGVDSLLVGDSLGNVLQGRSTTLAVSIEEMAYHTGCVARGQSDGMDHRGPAIRQLPRVRRGRHAQLRPADAARRAHGQTRGRRLDRAHRALPGRSRCSGVRPPGLHPAVGACARRLPGAGARRGRRPDLACTGRGARRGGRGAVGVGNGAGRLGARASRRRCPFRSSASAPAAAAAARSWCCTTCWD